MLRRVERQLTIRNTSALMSTAYDQRDHDEREPIVNLFAVILIGVAILAAWYNLRPPTVRRNRRQLNRLEERIDRIEGQANHALRAVGHLERKVDSLEIGHRSSSGQLEPRMTEVATLRRAIERLERDLEELRQHVP